MFLVVTKTALKLYETDLYQVAMMALGAMLYTAIQRVALFL